MSFCSKCGTQIESEGQQFCTNCGNRANLNMKIPPQTDGQVTADMVYGMYDGGLKVLDVINGVMMLVNAGFGIYTRFRLAKYKADGPKCLYILYASSAALSIIYNIALIALTGLNQVFSASGITSIVVSALVVFFNYKHFSKRKDLFNK